MAVFLDVFDLQFVKHKTAADVLAVPLKADIAFSGQHFIFSHTERDPVAEGEGGGVFGQGGCGAEKAEDSQHSEDLFHSGFSFSFFKYF
jgi:hypothetical protein